MVMIAPLLGLLLLAPRRVVAWLPPIDDKMHLYPGEPATDRKSIAFEGYRILRDSVPGSYHTSDPALWEQALKSEGASIIDKGDFSSYPEEDFNFIRAMRAAKDVKARFLGSVVITGATLKGSGNVTTVTLFGELDVSEVAPGGQSAATRLPIKAHVSVLGRFPQPIDPKALAGKYFVEVRRQTGIHLDAFYQKWYPANVAPPLKDPKTPGPKKSTGFPKFDPNKYHPLPNG